MCDIRLVEGKKYKVRLKTLEELLKDVHECAIFTVDEDLWDVESAHHTTNSQGEGLYKWLSRYMDGSLGYLTFDDLAPSMGVWVKWDSDGEEWYYQWDQLKVLGEV